MLLASSLLGWKVRPFLIPNIYSPIKSLKGNKNLGEGRNLVAKIKYRVLPVQCGLRVKIR